MYTQKECINMWTYGLYHGKTKSGGFKAYVWTHIEGVTKRREDWILAIPEQPLRGFETQIELRIFLKQLFGSEEGFKQWYHDYKVFPGLSRAGQKRVKGSPISEYQRFTLHELPWTFIDYVT